MIPAPAHDDQAYAQAARLLTEAQHVAVIGHLRPDADAIGSVSALTQGLRQLGKTVTPMIGQPTPMPENLLSIPGAEDIHLGGDIPAEADLVVAVDCGSIDRLGVVADQAEARADHLLVIDHHVSNTGYGMHNLVDTVESTTTILHRLLELMDVQLDKNIAHALYAGLVTDTGSFRWGTPVMHELASSLMRYDLDIRRIAEDLLDRTSVADLQLIGTVLSQLQILTVGEHTLAVLVVEAGHSGNAVERLIDVVRAVDGCDIGVVFKQQADGGWATSLRSTSINVAELAVALGGGGHEQAAGYSTRGSEAEIIQELENATRECVKEG